MDFFNEPQAQIQVIYCSMENDISKWRSYRLLGTWHP